MVLRNPKQPPGMYKTLEKMVDAPNLNWLYSRISAINSIITILCVFQCVCV